MIFSSRDPDLGKETYLFVCHCEHLKGACLHAEVPAFRHAGVAISEEKDEIVSFHSQ
jgi:hypothetical protein